MAGTWRTLLVGAVGMLLAVLFSMSAVAGQSDEAESFKLSIYPSGGIADYCKSGEFLDERLAIIVGFPSLSRDEETIRASIRCLMSLWPKESHEPGGAGVSNGMLALLYLSPKLVVEEIASRDDVIDDWLNQLKVLSFSWSESGPCKLDSYRKRLLLVLAATRASAKAEEARKRIIGRLSVLTCHIIS